MTEATALAAETLAPGRALELSELVYLAGLMAGLGAGSRSAANRVMRDINIPDGAHRSCIEGGGQMMFALLAPGARSLRVLTRCGSEPEGILNWRRAYFIAGAEPECWRAEFYPRETAESWNRAVSVAERVGGGERLRRLHATLGPRSQIYSVSWLVSGGHPQATVSWRLDRTYDPSEALSALGRRASWTAAQPIWEGLFGFVLQRRHGPWSIQLPLHTDESRVRVGSSRWTLRIEDPAKRQRLARLVERLGGDPRFAEGLYKLVQSANPSAGMTPVGRAVEMDLIGDQVTGAEFYLGAAPPRPLRAFREQDQLLDHCH